MHASRCIGIHAPVARAVKTHALDSSATEIRLILSNLSAIKACPESVSNSSVEFRFKTFKFTLNQRSSIWSLMQISPHNYTWMQLYSTPT
jgi:hypothetical protein